MLVQTMIEKLTKVRISTKRENSLGEKNILWDMLPMIQGVGGTSIWRGPQETEYQSLKLWKSIQAEDKDLRASTEI